jgi:hypothetical protein
MSNCKRGVAFLQAKQAEYHVTVISFKVSYTFTKTNGICLQHIYIYSVCVYVRACVCVCVCACVCLCVFHGTHYHTHTIIEGCQPSFQRQICVFLTIN